MADRQDLKGQVALVTGAARNIGRAIALALAGAGADIAIIARSDQGAADAVAREVEALGCRATVVLGDVSREDDAARLVDQTVKALGRLDILVNNAAIRREAPVETLSYTDWRDVMGVTLDGAFLMIRAAIPHLLASGHGSIINIGGLTAYTGAPNRAHVISAKAGLDGLTKALAHELGPRGITVNIVAPGMIETNRAHTGGAEPTHHQTTRTLVGRRGTAEEVAAAVRYLAGSDARFTNGQTLHINGGAYLP
ncbi:3-oxoacyl-ACP reductase FabG [Rhizobium sp. TH2]|uniref:SDR family NAD(P)-dependent oxidoreductase n=1 Tax=Rhizobium sp. TH2 TaxID=2775403 RepID=UPI0021586317|nr:3-oxoacyl-ACP reductase FabG [Rhizobium sp. TH2]UVC08637.1 3-oxoacyl-ACP reductase FabG [Rhizobium sp. TH2]